MTEALTQHFCMLDYAKILLSKATTKEQEERVRKIIDYERKQENHLYIQKELAKEQD